LAQWIRVESNGTGSRLIAAGLWNEGELASLVRTKDMPLVLNRLPYTRMWRGSRSTVGRRNPRSTQYSNQNRSQIRSHHI